MTRFQLKALVVAMAVALPVYAQQTNEPVTQAADQQANQAKENQGTPTKNAADEDVEVVEVTGIRQADLKARDLEREKNGFSSVIATDDIGNFVDQNVAESLRRLPGVTLQRSEGEGKYVSVRGLGPGFVSVNMNGSEMAGVGDDRKVGLDGIPADLLGSIEVLKTLTPDQNLNSIGGTVNVKAISAYDRGKDGLKFKMQNSYSQMREENSPKFSLDGTQFLFDKKVGIGFAVSHENRKTQVDEHRHHSTGELQFYRQDVGLTDEQLDAKSGPEILGPRQLEVRREIANRTRKAAAVNLEFKPNELNYFYIKGNFTEYSDEDIAQREFYDFQDAGSYGNGEIAYVNGQSKEFILTDIDVFHQYFIQGGDNKTRTFSFGGENKFGETWAIDYEFAKSKSTDSSVGDHRVQFRERDLIVYGKGGRDYTDAKVVTPEYAAELGGYAYDPENSIFGTSGSGDASDLNNWAFDNLFLEDGTRTDDLKNAEINLTKDFFLKHLNYIKVGIAGSKRTHVRNKDRWSFDPSASDCDGNQECIDVVNSSLADYPNSMQPGGIFQYPFEDKETVDYMSRIGRQTTASATNGEVSVDSTKEDYTLTEDTKAAYVMAEMPVNDDLTVIAGVRWVETEFASDGYLSLENDDFEFNGAGTGSLDIAIPLPEASIKYSEYFPSVHIRYEPSNEILVRGAIWTSFTRPSFKQARGFAKFDSDIELCPPGTDNCDDSQGSASVRQLQDYILGSDNTLDVGNPNLVAMSSINYDASIGWYPNKDLFMEAAIFYKDIENFIVDVNGISMSLEDLPLSLPINQVTQFVIPQDLVLNNVNITLNGKKATVMGVELSYNQYFENGLFVQSNMTLLDSEAQLDETIRVDKVPLPDQADTTANLTLGWENETYSARLIANYRSDIFEEVGACPAAVDASDVKGCKTWADRYQAPMKTLDFKAKYKLNKHLSFYFDAINLTDQSDLRYFVGNEMSGGNLLYQKEEYGRTYQLGLDYKFY
ncbi:TonB-dependent receptor [Neptunicella marina]|uniref:TonB-dependent receptor n=1 Tax=Neptunicella marina TaxID=2125989 RepID=A0A8J6ITS3_9ALTE|nr:TonB-dependent receptor [Neptunicella marina]MBC3765690.1 TonB-dependent receptor [Neptunicella marina]